jgi:hypothetical protein
MDVRSCGCCWVIKQFIDDWVGWLLVGGGSCEVLVVQARRLRRSVSMNDCRLLVEEIAECPGVGENAGCLWVATKDMPGYRVGLLWKVKLLLVDTWIEVGTIAETEGCENNR